MKKPAVNSFAFYLMMILFSFTLIHCSGTDDASSDGDSQSDGDANESPDGDGEVPLPDGDESLVPDGDIEDEPPADGDDLIDGDMAADGDAPTDGDIADGDVDIETEAEVEAEVGFTEFTLYSPAFKDGADIPVEYGCYLDGDYWKPSIPLKWVLPPEGTKSYILLMNDLDPISNYWVHWVVINIPAIISELPEGASKSSMPAGSTELLNTYMEIGYGGPCPSADTHSYRFQLFAMGEDSVTLDSSSKTGEALTTEIMGMNPIDVAELYGNFSKH